MKDYFKKDFYIYQSILKKTLSTKIATEKEYFAHLT